MVLSSFLKIYFECFLVCYIIFFIEFLGMRGGCLEKQKKKRLNKMNIKVKCKEIYSIKLRFKEIKCRNDVVLLINFVNMEM